MSRKLRIGLSLSCIDYRLFPQTIALLQEECCVDRFDHTILPGASLGYNQDKYECWKPTFLDQVDLAIQLHDIQMIVVVDHKDCGAYHLFYPDSTDHPHYERKLHIKNILRFIHNMKRRYPQFTYAGYLLALDGGAEIIYREPCDDPDRC